MTSDELRELLDEHKAIKAAVASLTDGTSIQISIPIVLPGEVSFRQFAIPEDYGRSAILEAIATRADEIAAILKGMGIDDDPPPPEPDVTVTDGQNTP